MDKKEAIRWAAATIAVAVGLVLMSGVPALATEVLKTHPHSDQETERAWNNGHVVQMILNNVRTGEAKSNAGSYYLMGPTDPAHPQEDDLYVDCVTRVPGDDGFKSDINYYGVYVGPNANASNSATRFSEPMGGDLVYAADLGHGLESLTSADKIEEAAAMGIASLVYIGANSTIRRAN